MRKTTIVYFVVLLTVAFSNLPILFEDIGYTLPWGIDSFYLFVGTLYVNDIVYVGLFIWLLNSPVSRRLEISVLFVGLGLIFVCDAVRFMTNSPELSSLFYLEVIIYFGLITYLLYAIKVFPQKDEDGKEAKVYVVTTPLTNMFQGRKSENLADTFARLERLKEERQNLGVLLDELLVQREQLLVEFNAILAGEGKTYLEYVANQAALASLAEDLRAMNFEAQIEVEQNCRDLTHQISTLEDDYATKTLEISKLYKELLNVPMQEYVQLKF